MSSQPPSGPPSEPPSGPGGPTSGPPTGPPSGPLSGPSAGASSGPPTEPANVPPPPPGASGPPSQPPPRNLVPASGGGRTPWWRSPRNIAIGVGVAIVAAVLAVVLTNQSTKTTPQAAQEVALQPVGSSGPNPFTTSVDNGKATPTASPPPSAAASGGTHSGGQPGLYGGTRSISSCDVPKLARFLNTNPDKARAWASVEGISPSAISAYLDGLTPVVLRVDTRVTNHGFSNGVATPFQSVLQAGTAVLVDAHGVPRVRCACGNPLLPPAPSARSSFTGTAWPEFREQDVVEVTPAPTVINIIVLVDEDSGRIFGRPVGGTGDTDTTTIPSPSASTSTSASASGSASESASSSAPPSASGSVSSSHSAPGSSSHSAGSSSSSGASGPGGSASAASAGSSSP